jgi:predicted DNA-binding transcriptional regulator AlpA
MREIETLLGVEEIVRIFGLSRVSIYRKVAAARAGLTRFPLPVSDCRQKLRWCAADVEKYCQISTQQPQVIVSSPKQKSKQAKECQARQDAVQQGFVRHGISPNKERAK